MAVFLVALSRSADFPIDVDWQTVPGTAAAGLDCAPQANHLHFLPGELTKTIVVAVYGDLLNEMDETFQVVLTNVVNASLTRTAATGTIVDDDPVPVLSIGNAAVVEGNAGVTNAVFVVSLSFSKWPASECIVFYLNGAGWLGFQWSVRGVHLARPRSTFPPTS